MNKEKPDGISRGRNILIDALYYQDDFVNYVERAVGRSGSEMEGMRNVSRDGKEVPDGLPVKTLDVRIWQLKDGVPLGMRYSTLYGRKKKGFGKPSKEEYEPVYEGMLAKSDLESMEERMTRCTPDDFGGHQLSVSDVVELSQEGDSRFFYAEAEGFEEIDLP